MYNELSKPSDFDQCSSVFTNDSLCQEKRTNYPSEPHTPFSPTNDIKH